MVPDTAASTTTPQSVLKKVYAWQQKASVPFLPLPDDQALALLTDAKVPEEDISTRLDKLTLNGERATHRVIAHYPDLHALDRLDEASEGMDLSSNLPAAGVRALLQAAEIAILNIKELSERIVVDVTAGHLGDAQEKNAWIGSLHQSLFSLSRLAAQMPLHGKGTHVSFAESPHMGLCLEAIEAMHQSLIDSNLVQASELGSRQLYEHGRNLTHHAYVDTMYYNLWFMATSTINVPGVKRAEEEDAHDFYKRFIGSEAVYKSVFELDQIGDNFFRQFRAYHQMSEVLLKHANQLIADSARRLLTQSNQPEQNLLTIKDNLRTANAILAIVVENIIPVNRNLGHKKFHELRGSLGITSGSNSPNIKAGLFELYDHLVNAVKLHVAKTDATAVCDEQALDHELASIVAEPGKDLTTHALYDILSETLAVHEGLRAWRGTHMQFVRGNLGAARRGEVPAVSISSTKQPLKLIHQFSRQAHGPKDPITPIYEALLGKPFDPVPSFANMFAGNNGPDGNSFVSRMLNETAASARNLNQDTQNRVLYGGSGGSR